MKLTTKAARLIKQSDAIIRKAECVLAQHHNGRGQSK